MYKYQLRKGGKKEICPNCGQRRFVPYVLTEDNATLAGDGCGRCDREQSCGYWKKPDGNVVLSETQATPYVAEPIVMDGEVLKAVCNIDWRHRNSLWPYAVWLVGGREAMDAFSRYKVGQWFDMCVFPQIDVYGNVRSGKMMQYKDGHRVKDGVPVRWLHKVKTFAKYVHGEAVNQCLFGEHLLNEYPDKAVAIVESEKTAVLMSAIEPDRLWLACGGSQNLKNVEKLKPLEGRIVTLVPDHGQWIAWRKLANDYSAMKGRDFSISCDPTCSMLRDGMKQGYDILDLYEKWRKDDERKKECQMIMEDVL